jgi:hypothetical protein
LNKKDNDGIFFMDFNDFIKYYEDCQFCLVNDRFQYTSIKATTSRTKGAYFKMTVFKRGKYFVTVNQTSKRLYPESI